MLRELTSVRDATDAVNARLTAEIARHDATRESVESLEAWRAQTDDTLARYPSEELARELAALREALDLLTEQVTDIRNGLAAERARAEEENQALLAAMARRSSAPSETPSTTLRATLVGRK